MLSIKRWVLAGVGAAALATSALAAPPVTETFTSAPVLSPTQAPGVWYTDRYAPAGFTSVIFGGDSRLQHSINAVDCETCRPPSFVSSFYNTQGRKFDLANDTVVMSIDLYVPSSWATTGKRMAGLWGTAFTSSNAVAGFPIVEFTSSADGTGVPRFRGWDNGAWVDMGLPTGFMYDAWYKLTIQLTGGMFRYTVGNLALSVPGPGSSYIGNVILQGHNTASPGVTYDILWDNFSHANASAALALTPVSTCVNNANRTFVVNIDMSAAPQAIVGGQFFIEYDNSILQLTNITTGSAPFTQEVYRNFSGNPLSPDTTLPSGTGLIDFAVGVPGGGPGTLNSTTMAVLTFQANQDVCASASNLVTFRAHTPATRLSNALGDPIAAALADLSSIRIDKTDPVITCPSNVTVNADAGGCTASPSAALAGPWLTFGNAVVTNKAGGGDDLSLLLSAPAPGDFGVLRYTPPSPLLFNALTTLSASYNMQSGCFG